MLNDSTLSSESIHCNHKVGTRHCTFFASSEYALCRVASAIDSIRWILPSIMCTTREAYAFSEVSCVTMMSVISVSATAWIGKWGMKNDEARGCESKHVTLQV